jgi:hypothetical protein
MLNDINTRRIKIHGAITRGALAVLVAFSSFPAGAAAPNKRKSNVEPLRTYQFRFEAADPIQSIHSYLDFIRKVSPGLEGLYSNTPSPTC